MTQATSTEHPVDAIRQIFANVLGLGSRAASLNADTQLLGALPELDSMAVATILTALEEHFHILIEDEDINADMFETIGTLTGYVENKLKQKSALKP